MPAILTVPAVPHIKQPKDSLCWATCICMLIKTFGDPVKTRDITPERIAARALYDDTKTVNHAVWDSKILASIQDYNATDYSRVVGLATFDMIKASLGKNRPVILSFGWSGGGGGGHCFVISGYDEASQTLTVNDPLDDASKTVAYDDLKQGNYEGGLNVDDVYTYLAK